MRPQLNEPVDRLHRTVDVCVLCTCVWACERACDRLRSCLRVPHACVDNACWSHTDAGLPSTRVAYAELKEAKKHPSSWNERTGLPSEMFIEMCISSASPLRPSLPLRNTNPPSHILRPPLALSLHTFCLGGHVEVVLPHLPVVEAVLERLLERVRSSRPAWVRCACVDRASQTGEHRMCGAHFARQDVRGGKGLLGT